MVTNELALLGEQLRSGELVDREVAAKLLVQAGPDGISVLAATAMDAQATVDSRLTALRHLPANDEAIPVLRRLLEDPVPSLRHWALVKAEQARARPLIPQIRKLTTDPERYWDLDGELAIAAVARRVLDSFSLE